MNLGPNMEIGILVDFLDLWPVNRTVKRRVRLVVQFLVGNLRLRNFKYEVGGRGMPHLGAPPLADQSSMCFLPIWQLRAFLSPVHGGCFIAPV